DRRCFVWISRVGPFPIESTGTFGQRSIFQLAIIETDNRNNLAHIARGEDFVCLAEVFNFQYGFMNGNACVAQQIDDALASDAIEERAISGGSEHLAAADYENVRSCSFSVFATIVGHQSVVKAL